MAVLCSKLNPDPPADLKSEFSPLNLSEIKEDKSEVPDSSFIIDNVFTSRQPEKPSLSKERI